MRHRIPLFTFGNTLRLALVVAASCFTTDAFSQRGFGRFPGFDGPTPEKQLEPEELNIKDGAARIPDHATFQKLSYKGEEVMIDTFLADLEFVKFTIDDVLAEKPKFYFINTTTHRAHMMFGRAAGVPRRGWEQMKGVLVYRPRLKAPSGNPGLFTFEFEPFDSYSFELVLIAQGMLIDRMPGLKGNIGYYPRGQALAKYEEEKEIYEGSEVTVYLDEDLTDSNVGYLPLNLGETFGRLRLMKLDERPGPRDVVIYESLPNELSRVAGVITGVRQTPLSHVNLRAVQDKIPNAFITNAAQNGQIKSLIGKNVSYKVTVDGFEIREATADEVDAHFVDQRPKETQVPNRDLTVKQIRPLTEITFEDSKNVGVKATNVAVLGTFGFPSGTIPEGFAVPFYFYDEFMKHNGFYDYAEKMMTDSEFAKNRETQEKQLKKFRKLIKGGSLPEWMMDALDKMHKSVPKGTSLRCRSSTNNEDLPGYSGAGLYGSYTHKIDEGHISKSIKQVYASLWNFRAFEEREFYRVDHLKTAMGVLVHPNYKGELANGVAVTDDILYETEANYYVNVQVGEDLVTNPESQSIPEEILLGWWKEDGHEVIRYSNRSDEGQSILSEKHLEELRRYLGKIHSKFSKLYGRSLDDYGFAMEIEFKVTKDGVLAIKQARPWVYSNR